MPFLIQTIHISFVHSGCKQGKIVCECACTHSLMYIHTCITICVHSHLRFVFGFFLILVLNLYLFLERQAMDQSSAVFCIITIIVCAKNYSSKLKISHIMIFSYFCVCSIGMCACIIVFPCVIVFMFFFLHSLLFCQRQISIAKLHALIDSKVLILLLQNEYARKWK